MFRLRELVRPRSAEEALSLLRGGRNNVILGGTTFLRLSQRSIQKGIDLSLLGLDQIEEGEEGFFLGAMVRYQEIIEHEKLRERYPALAQALRQIVGTQFRQLVTVGGSVSGRYGFSDLMPLLLVMDATVQLAGEGWIPIREFQRRRAGKDLVLQIFLPSGVTHLSHQCLRRNAGDIPMLNLSLAKSDRWQVALGARPDKALLAEKTARYLDEGKIEEAGEIIGEELCFGSNMRASAQYRREVAPVLLRRAWEEVHHDGDAFNQ